MYRDNKKQLHELQKSYEIFVYLFVKYESNISF